MQSFEKVLNLFFQQNEARMEAFVQFLPRILIALAIIFVFSLVAIWAGRLVSNLFKNDRNSEIIRRFTRRTTVFFVILLGVFFSLPLLGLTNVAAALLAGGGIGAIILGFAFRDLGENLISGVFLAISRPFDINDLVASGDFEGVVQSLTLRNTHIRTSDGRDIYLPNATVIKQPLVNYTRDGYRRFSFTVGVDYDDNALEARSVLQDTLESVDGVLKDPTPSVIVNELSADTVDLLSHYWVDAFTDKPPLAEVRSRVIDQCKSALLENGYTLPGKIVEIREFSTNDPVQLKKDNGENSFDG